MKTAIDQELELARATIANTIMYCGVDRDAKGWKISATLPASGRSGLTLDLGRGPEEPIEVRGATFADALDRIVASGVTMIGDPKERYADLLRASKMQSF